MKIKDIIKAEVEQEVKNLVDLAIEEHSNIVSINQIQRVPDNKMEGFKAQLKNLNDVISDASARYTSIQNKFNEFDKLIPEFNLKINNLLMDMNFKASSEDVSKLFNIIPNLITKDDYEVIQSCLAEKVTMVDHIEVKKQISLINNNMKMLVP